MQARNEIRMRILKDGTISIDTDSFEETVHQQAEELINDTLDLLGGERRIVENKTPEYGNNHTHNGWNSSSH